ncbi:MAG: tetratricopeptide repeat protein [Anaerolineae bacterium]|nr:tetratricopeptide repeat protein [Anaerolineae bacterium]
MDEGDNDPVRFWSYVIAALQTVQEDVGLEAAIALGSPPVPPVEDLLAALINQIDSLPSRAVLVLGDYHLISAQPVHDGLTYLLAHLPDGVHLAIATRADPPLRIARLRRRGQVNELRQADLRFTGHQASAFLNEAMGLGLSADDVAALTARTEGWISGLQMAAASLMGQDEPTRFIHAFTGSDRHVLDYLVEEVLHRQPDHIQTFLLRTAILDRLTGPLCDALLELSGAREGGDKSESPGEEDPSPRPRAGQEGQEILESLERANLFIVPLDNERQWYRYHRLFVDLLRKRLHQVCGNLVPALHRRASEWCEQNGWTAEAIEHALAAQDLERAAELIEGAAEPTLMHSEVATLLRWLEALPEGLIRRRPSLSLYRALALLLSGRPWDLVRSRLEDVDAGLIPGQAASLRALVAVFKGQMPRAAELSRQALENLPQDDRFMRGLAAWLLSTSQLAEGDLATAGQVLCELSQVSQENGNVMVAVGTLGNLARVRARQACLQEAKAIYERAIALATDEQGRVLPIAGRVMVGLGDLLREWNELDAAARCLEEGIQLTERWREVAAFPGYINLARVRQSQGDAEGAREAIREARRLAVEFLVPTPQLLLSCRRSRGGTRTPAMPHIARHSP